MLCCWLEDGERGQEPKDASSFCRLEKARQHIFFQSLQNDELKKKFKELLEGMVEVNVALRTTSGTKSSLSFY